MQEKPNIAGKRIDQENMKAGDIILSTTTAEVSKAVRVATRSDISHVMVCVETMLRLYNTLACLHRKRLDVATKWLESRGKMAPRVKPVLRPHTAQWFAALEPWDPHQAGFTRSVIETAGSSEVCSICGDYPASVYRLGESDRPPYGVDTFRLCRDCFGTRTDTGQHLDFLPEGSADQPSRAVPSQAVRVVIDCIIRP